MKLLEDLDREHQLIERVAASFVSYASRACSSRGGAAGSVDPRDGEAYMRFFRLFAGRLHHAREEDVLFPALVQETGAPLDRGPLAVLIADHLAMGKILDAIEPLIGRAGVAGDGEQLFGHVSRYVSALLHHIDAERTVLYPECEMRFRRASVIDLPSREPDEEEAAARDEGARLVLAYPPRDGVDADRGDGCFGCPAYGDSCEGLEREWWSEQEFEEARERMASG